MVSRLREIEQEPNSDALTIDDAAANLAETHEAFRDGKLLPHLKRQVFTRPGHFRRDLVCFENVSRL